MKSLLEEIKHLNGWDYYDRGGEKCQIQNWNDSFEQKKFIKDFLKISGKELVESHFFTDDLEKVGISLDNFERATHTNSVFFLGCLLYEKLALKDKIAFVRADGKNDEFHFIWFLTSLVHDFGYFAENDKSNFPHITEDISSLNVTHNLLDYKRIGNKYLKEAYDGYQEAAQKILDYIPTYFKEAFNGCRGRSKESKIEHGIYSGLVLYDGLVKNRIERKKQQDNGAEEKSPQGLYWEDDLDKFYAIASFSIAIHNMRRNGIVQNSENLKFSIDTEPYLFLFGLVDTIEPTKTFDCMSAEYVLENILIDISTNEIILRNVPSSKLDFSKLIEKVSGLKSWIDVDVIPENNKVTIKINHK